MKYYTILVLLIYKYYKPTIVDLGFFLGGGIFYANFINIILNFMLGLTNII